MGCSGLPRSNAGICGRTVPDTLDNWRGCFYICDAPVPLARKTRGGVDAGYFWGRIQGLHPERADVAAEDLLRTD